MAITYPTPTVINTAVPTPTATDVYSADNVQQAVTQPVTRPDLADPFGLYEQYMKAPEITEAQRNVAETQAAINASQQALRSTTRALENQNQGAMGTTGASVNLIGRQVGRARQLTGDELAGLGENLQAQTAYLNTLQTDAQNRYQIANQERAQLQDLIRATSGKAGIKYSDSYEDALQKADKYERKLQKEAEKKAEEAKASAYKDSLKAQLRAMGSNYKGLSTNELERKLAKKNKRALEEAKQRSEAEWNMKVAQFNKSMSGGGSSTPLKTSYTNTEQNRMIEEALAGGENWDDIKQTFMGLGIPVDEGSNMDDYLKRKFGYN